MKIRLPKKLKIALIAIFFIAFSVTAYIAYMAWKVPGLTEEKLVHYSYSQKADVNYRVYLYPNPIYKQESLGKGKIYLTPFVKNINTLFKYEFQGERPADFKGEYDITACVKGIKRERQGEEWIIKTIWSKDYELLPKTSFAGKDKAIAIEKVIPIDFRKYNEFVQKFIEDTKIGSEVLLAVRWNVNIEAQTDKGPVKEQVTPEMVIPLNKNYFEIEGEMNKEKKGAIEEVIKKTAPVDLKKIKTYDTVAGICFLICIVLTLFTTTNANVDPLEKAIKQILKKHNDRLVALDKEITVEPGSSMFFKSIEDLVIIADEISKPIMYKDNSETERKVMFYVLDEPKVYVYELHIPPSTEENLEVKVKEINSETVKQ